jgi:hypothetical protein
LSPAIRAASLASRRPHRGLRRPTCASWAISVEDQALPHVTGGARISSVASDREARAMAERAANEAARERGEPLPFPNPWDALDPTKVPPDATPEEIARSYAAFAEICRTPPCIRHVL